MIIIRDALSKDNINYILDLLDKVEWKEGFSIHDHYKKEVKQNKELRARDGTSVNEAIQFINKNVYSSKLFQEEAFPKLFVRPRFNLSENGGFYGPHSDAGVMPGTTPVRSDLSSTLWLTEDYEGGELIIQTPEGEKSYKEPAGSLILYPCQYVHETRPVTKGQRICCITWIQSFIRDHNKRLFMNQFLKFSLKLKEQQGFSDLYIESTSLFNNLLRDMIE